MKKRKPLSDRARKAKKLCVRCGNSPEDHALVNYCGGNTTSYRHDLVCPTALYKPRRKGPAMTPAARASLLDLIERLGPVYWALNKGQGRTEFRALIDDLQKEAVRLLVENADASSRLATLEGEKGRATR